MCPRVFLQIVSVLVASTHVHAATLLWNGGGADDNWSSAANWSGVGFTAGDSLQFGGSTRLSPVNNLTADTLVGGITFLNDTNPNISVFTLSGNRITLGGDITTVAATGGAFNATIHDQIGLDLILNATRTMAINNNGDKTHNLTISGIISDGGGGFGLIKSGGARLTLNGANTYTGPTTITGGALVLGHISALPAISSLTLAGTANDGGVLGLGAADFTRSLGTGDGEVRWTGHGGFAAFGADRVVNLGGAGATVQWGVGGFVPSGSTLVFGYGNGTDSQDSTHTVTFQNAIDLNGGTRSIRVNDGNNGGSLGAARIDAILTGGIINSTGSGALTKDGAGVLSLTAASTYTGETRVNDGVLLLNHANALPGGTALVGGTSNLRLGGGNAVIGLTAVSGDFTRALGTGVSQVQWTSGGGFAAYGEDRIVNLGGSGAMVTWASGSFVTNGQSLSLGHTTADAQVDFQNDIDLGAAVRTVNAIGNSGGTFFGAMISGTLSGSGGLTKTGDGNLILSATDSSFTGQVTNTSSILQVTKLANFGQNSSLGQGTAGVAIALSSEFRSGTLSYVGGGDSSDRLFQIGTSGVTHSSGGIIQNNGTGALIFNGAYFNSTVAGVTAARTLTLGGTNTDLNTISGTIQNTNGTAGILNVTKANAGIWALAGANTYTGTTSVSAGALHLNHADALGGGGGLTVSTGAIIDNSSGAAITLSSANLFTLGTFIYGGTNDLSFANGTSLITASRTLTLNGTGKTLTLGTLNLTTGSSTLTVNDGGGGSQLKLGGIVLSEANQARTLTIAGSAVVEVTGTISDGSGTGADSLSYTGTSILTLQGSNTYTGTTTMNNAAGTLVLNGSSTASAVTLSAGRLNMNHAGAAGTGTLTLTAGTLDNTSGAAIISNFTGNVVLGGNFAFGGTNNLSFASGTASAGGGRTITLNGTDRTLAFGILSFTTTTTFTANDAGTGNKLVLGGVVLAEANQARTQTFTGSAVVDILGSVTDGSGTGADSLSYTGTSILTLQGSNTYTGTTTMNNAAGTLVLNGSSTASAVTLTAGRLNMNHAGAAGTGTLTLTAGTLDNTSGAAIVSSFTGNVVLNGNFAFGGTNNLSFASGTASASGNRTITLNGAGRTLAFGVLSFTNATTFTVNDAGTGNKIVLGGVVLAENDQARTQIFTGSAAIDILGPVTDGTGTGGDGLTYTGSSVLRLMGAGGNWATTVNTSSGILRTTATGGIGVGALTMLQGTLELNNAAQTVASLNLGSSTNTTQVSAATITLGSGTILTLGGTLTSYDNVNTQASFINGGTIDLNGSRTWTVEDSASVDADLTVSSVIQNTGAVGTFTKNNTGRLVLTGNNTFADIFAIADGIVRIEHANALGSTAGGTTINSGDALEVTGGITVAGESLAINGSGVSTTGALRILSGINAWTGTINLTGDARINADAGAQLTVSDITAGGASLDITFGGAGDIIVSGRIGSGGTTPVDQVLKDGSGTLTLENATNDFTGTLTINDGMVKLGASQVIPDAENVTINKGTLELNGQTEAMATLTLGATTTTVAGNSASVIDTIGGGILRLGGNVTYNVGSAGFENGQASISANLDLNNASRTITVNDNAALAHDLIITGVISNSGAAVTNLTKAGLGTLVLSGANSYNGATVINLGTLKLGADNVLPDTALTLDQRAGGTATLDLAGHQDTLGGTLTLGSTSAGTAVNSVNQIIDSVGGGVLSLGGGVTYNSGTTGFHNATSTISANLNLNGASRTFTINDSINAVDDLVVSGVISNSAGTAAGITKSNAGTLVLSGANTYDGDTSVSTGVLRAEHNQAFGTTGSVSLANTGAVVELGNGITINRALTVVNSGGNKVLRLQNGASAATYSGGISIADTTLGEFDVSADTGGTLTLSGDISGTGAAGLSKEGAGTVVLSGANTYTGVTSVNAGNLQVGSNGVGQTGTGAVTVASGATLSGTGVVRSAAFTLADGATLRAGDGVADSAHGTLYFTPATASGTTHDLQGNIILGITSATIHDGTYGGFVIGSTEYQGWVDAVVGAGSHDRLVFNNPAAGTGYTLNFLTATGGLQVVPSSFTAQSGQVFNLLDWQGMVTANFTGFTFNSGYLVGNGDEGADLDLPDLTGTGLFWDVSRLTISGNIVVVPEPSRCLLLLAGLALTTLRRRRVACEK